jgi:hypothetical protein
MGDMELKLVNQLLMRIQETTTDENVLDCVRKLLHVILLGMMNSIKSIAANLRSDVSSTQFD